MSKFLEYQTIALVTQPSLGINSELLNIPAYARVSRQGRNSTLDRVLFSGFCGGRRSRWLEKGAEMHYII